MVLQGALFSASSEYSSNAYFSSDRLYRYLLTRTWDSSLPMINFLMLNPSTADEIDNDPTIARQIERSKRWGFGSLVITNLFAWRSTDPRALPKVAEPVGPENDRCIVSAAHQCAMVLCGWGNHGNLNGRADHVRALLRHCDHLKALKVTKEGQPQHPLYLGYNTIPEKFNA